MCFSCFLPYERECALNLLRFDQHAGMFSTHLEVKTTECVTPVKNPYTSKMCFHLFVINGRGHAIHIFKS